MSMVSHYPDRPKLVTAMTNLAVEELQHFREVVKIITSRGLIMSQDEKDPYVGQLRRHLRAESSEYMLDRLLLGSVIEARGEERFRLIADGLKDAELQRFYQAIANSEAGHHQLFLDLAHEYFSGHEVRTRLQDWVEIEASTLAELPIRSRLH